MLKSGEFQSVSSLKIHLDVESSLIPGVPTLLKSHSSPPSPAFRVTLVFFMNGGRLSNGLEFGCSRFELVGKNFRKRKKGTHRLWGWWCVVLWCARRWPFLVSAAFCPGWRYCVVPSFKLLLLSLYFSQFLSWAWLVGLRCHTSLPFPSHSLLSFIKKSINILFCFWSELSSAGDGKGKQPMDSASIANPLNTPRKGPKSRLGGVHSSVEIFLPKVGAILYLQCTAGRKDKRRNIAKKELKTIPVLVQVISAALILFGFVCYQGRCVSLIFQVEENEHCSLYSRRKWK